MRSSVYVHLCEDTKDFLPSEPLADPVIILKDEIPTRGWTKLGSVCGNQYQWTVK